MDHKNDAIPISQAPKHFPGTRPALCTLYRWMQRGVRGVRLESFCVGSRRYVTPEAIQRFIERTTAAGPYSSSPSEAETSKARRRSIEAAERELDQAGI